jgi:hypothetical protein
VATAYQPGWEVNVDLPSICVPGSVASVIHGSQAGAQGIVAAGSHTGGQQLVFLTRHRLKKPKGPAVALAGNANKTDKVTMNPILAFLDMLLTSLNCLPKITGDPKIRSQCSLRKLLGQTFCARNKKQVLIDCSGSFLVQFAIVSLVGLGHVKQLVLSRNRRTAA